MRAAKVATASMGYRVSILVFAMSLMLLVALSRTLFRDQVSTSIASETFQVPVSVPSKGQGYPPVLAYWICGTNGDRKRMVRLLKAIYHPRNRYLLQLDAQSSDKEREDLLLSIQSDSVLRSFGNVDVVGKSYPINQMGSSALAAVLHAAAMLLKLSADWDWFISLSASDYPLVSQDDILHSFMSLPKDPNFIAYNNTDWKEKRNINQVVVDPSLHLRKSSYLYYAVETRTTPDAFEIFGGSPWMILTRAFIEYCIQAYDNLPRKLLMYFSNTASPIEYYFHTVLCNSPEFRNTTVNTNLWYNIPRDLGNEAAEPRYEKMLASGAAFARPFKEGDWVLDHVDENVLNRLPDKVVPGKWCLSLGMNVTTENSKAEADSCSTWSNNIDEVDPGPYGLKLASLLSKLTKEEGLKNNQCH